jgi:broad specificity phosphatase PhoE
VPTDKELRSIARRPEEVGIEKAALAREVLRKDRALRQISLLCHEHGTRSEIRAAPKSTFAIRIPKRGPCPWAEEAQRIIDRALRPARAKKARQHA